MVAQECLQKPLVRLGRLRCVFKTVAAALRRNAYQATRLLAKLGIVKK